MDCHNWNPLEIEEAAVSASSGQWIHVGVQGGGEEENVLGEERMRSVA